MSDSRKTEVRLGRYLAAVREESGLTQAEVARKVTFSTATLSRIESGEKAVSDEEVASMLKAIGTDKARQLSEYLKQQWDQIDRPAFDHPNREALWQANLALGRLACLREDPELKSVFVRQIDLYEKELKRLADFLASREHRIAYIGSIGVGKSTAICKLTGLLKAGEDKLDRQIVLETGAGGITLCEVHVSQGPKYGLRIVPRTEDSIRQDVEDWCDYLIRSTHQDAATTSPTDEEDGDPLGISKEVVRAIRNMAGLAEKRRVVDGKRLRHDPARELAESCTTARELVVQVLTRMNLFGRNQRDAWYPDECQESPEDWLQKLFSDVNNGRDANFTLPEKIEIIVPAPVLDSRELPLRIIDTKGIDQTAERQDLECHFDDPRTLVVLCSRFNDAPEVSIQTLLHRAKEAGIREISQKTVLLVLPRPDEALAVKYDDGARVEDEEEGCDLKRDQIHLSLSKKNLSDLSVEFFNAKENTPSFVRDRLIEKLRELRHTYSEQISRLADAADRLIENRENEQIRLVFEHVSSDLSTWIDKNRTLDPTDEGVHQPLVSAIDATRYASTVRAAVRRCGDWTNLDYYHHLAFGVRRTAVTQIGEKLKGFKVIAQNLMDNDELAPATEFLERVVARVGVVEEEAYRRIQPSGKEAFRQALEGDHEFWGECEDRWGQGPGYRTSISKMTDERLQSCYDDAHRLILNLISDEWVKIIEVLEEMLKEKESTPAS